MKKIAQYVPLRLGIFLVIGVLFAYYISIPIRFILILLPITCILLFVFFLLAKSNAQFRGLFQSFSYLLILLTGIISITLRDKSHKKTHYSHFIKNENSIVLQIEKVLKPTVYHNKYYVTILQIDTIVCKGKLVLNLARDSLSKALVLGNTYYTKTSIEDINSTLNPHTFNYKNYLKKQEVFHQLRLRKEDLLYLNIQNSNLKILVGRLREKIQISLAKQDFKTDELGIINAIVLGQRQIISKKLLESYAGAGAIHILAVSGLHVGILFLILSFLLKPIERFWNGSNLKMLLIVVILWGFALLTGLSGSVVRAVTMFTFIAIGLSIKKQKSGVLHALITSFFFLVMIYPLYIFDVGFQMSYAAVLGIVLFYPKLNSLLPKIKYALPRKIWQLLCVSVSATIGTLPISLYYFHQFPGLFFLSNIVIVPFIGMIMGAGIFVVILSLLQILPDFFVKCYSLVLSSMNNFIGWISHQEQFLIKDISFSIFMLVGSYLVIAMFYRWWSDKKSLKLQTFLLSLVFLQCIFIYEKYQTATGDELVIFHKTKESLIGIKKAEKLQIMHSLDSINTLKMAFIRNYKVGSQVKEISFMDSIPNIFSYKKTELLIIDSLSIYKNLSFKPDMVLLRQSPKINVDRLVQNLQPKILIADGSNYKSYVNFWRKTCHKHNTTFHYTAQNGALILE